MTCVVGEPAPKVLPIDGLDNDQIYENPSEQYVPHITGHVTSLWSNGTAKITYTTDMGYAFADGSTTKIVEVNEIDTDVAVEFSYTDNFGPVTCSEVQHPTFDSITCTFHDFTLTPGYVGSTPWQSDFDSTKPLGTMTYTVNADGTGYTGIATY